MESVHIELKDLAGEIGSQLADIDFDPAELDAVNQRLDKIYELEKKHRVETVEELLQMQHDIELKLNNIENSDELILELEKKLTHLHDDCCAKAALLTQKRTEAAARIEQEMQERLVPLGMPNVRFQVVVAPAELSLSGSDKVSVLFSANRSTALQPVSQVASGGEIARVMLSLKALISGAVKLPTIIFDEIDTGVSGKIAGQMAAIMLDMGRHERQVISITHLPQIAAKGMVHYKVYKEDTAEGTTSHMVRLSQEQRVTEIAQMLSGNDVSEAAMANARQLLEQS